MMKMEKMKGRSDRRQVEAVGQHEIGEGQQLEVVGDQMLETPLVPKFSDNGGIAKSCLQADRNAVLLDDLQPADIVGEQRPTGSPG